MFLKIAFLLFTFCFIDNCKFLENWTKMKVKFEPSPALLDGPMRLRVYSNGQMAMPFQIGTPRGSANIPAQYFRPRASSTFHNYNEEYSCIAYGSGYLASDNMNLLTTGNEAKPMDFMINTKNGEVTNETLVKIPADGILGLGPVGTSTVGMKTFPRWIMKKMGRNSAKMTFYFEKFNPQDPNEMAQNSFAMVDFTGKSSLPEFCNEQKWFHADKWPMPSTSLWMFTAKNIYLQSKNGAIKKFDENAEFIVSNSQFFTLIPKIGMDWLAEILKVKAHLGIYNLPCNATKRAPTIKFEFVNAKREKIFMEFKPEDYILPNKFGNCFLIFKSSNFHDFYVLGYSFFKGHSLPSAEFG